MLCDFCVEEQLISIIIIKANVHFSLADAVFGIFNVPQQVQNDASNHRIRAG